MQTAMHAKWGSRQCLQMLVIAFFATFSVYMTWSLVVFSKDVKRLIELRSHSRRRHTIKPLQSYSLVGVDHPTRLPVEQKLVKLLVQESVHYDLVAPESEQEWLWTGTIGDGHIRIGDEKRMFAVAMFHELHCLRAIRGVIENGWDTITKERQRHILHCFNYLRQYILCSADATLEPGDFTKRNFTTERVGATHTCVDWRPAYRMMNEKWWEWDKFRIAHNIPWHDDAT